MTSASQFSAALRRNCLALPSEWVCRLAQLAIEPKFCMGLSAGDDTAAGAHTGAVVEILIQL